MKWTLKWVILLKKIYSEIKNEVVTYSVVRIPDTFATDKSTPAILLLLGIATPYLTYLPRYLTYVLTIVGHP
jgi:hypothetical protein